MGLCKCPKRKVTNLFCFEHRVNVCEHCLVANHEKCIVKSYLQWLQDSDYSPLCSLCSRSLSDEECGPCVRLTCYDVFHWLCLNRHCQHLPANTAPAGYTCPTCNTCIFPPANLATPVAEVVRQLLLQVNWARAGLGLPLIDEPDLPRPAPSDPEKHSGAAPLTSTPVRADSSSDPRKLFDSTKDDGLFNKSHDHDEDKYKRRPALQFLARWFKSQDGGKKRDPNAVRKRFFMVLVVGTVAFITLVIIFSQLGRQATDEDPFLDPMNNPNIKVEQKPVAVEVNNIN